MAISPARIAAYEILVRIESDRAYSSVLLPQYEASLQERDAALCHQIVLGVLRRKLFLDHKIREFAGARKLDLEVLIALRIGAYQLLELDRIPAHSAVNESVALVQRAKKASAKGLVNAVLRRLSISDNNTVIEDAFVNLSHPQWLLDRWTAQFGAEHTNTIACSNNTPPRTAFRLTSKALAEIPAGTRRSEIIDGAFIVSRISEQMRDLAEDGQIYFQDEASQLIASMIAIPTGGRFLDICAAPGGKTTQIAHRYRDSGATVIAGDIHLKRAEFLRSNCIRQGETDVQVVQYDAAGTLPFREKSFDTVLVDAPCSGTGTIASNPEIRYFLAPEDILDLSRKQLKILVNASKLVKDGGRLYYSTCSLEREENEDVIYAFLSGADDFRLAKGEIDLRFLTKEGFGRTFPDRDGTDGFFFAQVVRQ